MKFNRMFVKDNMEQVKFVQTYKPKIYAGPTSMVSLIVPSGTNLNDLRQTMRKEHQTAGNIKNNTNRKSVQSALSNINEYLKNLKQIPHTGIAMFSEQYI